MRVLHTHLPGLVVIEPLVHRDERGFFMESYNRRALSNALGFDLSFVQDNHSKSEKNVARGLHYQLPPKAQGKLVRVTSGAIFDVAVDIRLKSNTFGKWFGIELNAKNHKQLWIPAGFAHGFIALLDNTEVLYKTTDYYAPDYERTISWYDDTIRIQLPEQIKFEKLFFSDKDKFASKNLLDAEGFI